MSNKFARLTQGLGLSLLTLGMAGQATAQNTRYLPDGPNVPTIALNESECGAACLPPLQVPAPSGWDQQSIWNMQVVGFNGNQGRASSDDGWIEHQGNRYILYMADSPGSAPNPQNNNVVEKNGTSVIDVTNPANPVYLHHIPAVQGSGSTHVAVCAGDTLPNAAQTGAAGHYYLLRHDGSTDQELWDVTNPSSPTEIAQLIGGLTANHHDWWECDTGIAYLIAQTKTDGWHETGSTQHIYIYNLSNPEALRNNGVNPSTLLIRQFGLPGQQPGATNSGSCMNVPSATCYEGVTKPPGGVHQIYSGGLYNGRVYIAYGVDSNGVIQILDRTKLLNGCNTAGAGGNPNASATCANQPSQGDLLWPQVSYVTMNPNQGGHTAVPIFGIPIPEEQENYLDGKPQHWDLLAITSEDTTNNCLTQAWKNPQLLDITNDSAIWPISTLAVGQFPGDFCAKGSRFGIHEVNRAINPNFYGRIVVAAYFNAGLQVWDIRDPYNPRRVAYFIQAPNANTMFSCGTYQGNSNYCRKATFSDLGEVDDRGYIYNMDRAGSGLTILQLTGDAAKVVSGQGNEAK